MLTGWQQQEVLLLPPPRSRVCVWARWCTWCWTARRQLGDRGVRGRWTRAAASWCSRRTRCCLHSTCVPVTCQVPRAVCSGAAAPPAAGADVPRLQATSHMQPVAFLPCDGPVFSPYHGRPELTPTLPHPAPPCLRPVFPRKWFSLTRHHAALAVADRHVAEAFRRHCYTRRGSAGAPP